MKRKLSLLLMATFTLLIMAFTCQAQESTTVVRNDTSKVVLLKYRDTTSTKTDTVFAYKVVQQQKGNETGKTYVLFVAYLSQDKRTELNPFSTRYVHNFQGLFDRPFNWKPRQ